MLANYISLALGVLEMIIYANTFYGIPFIQAIFEDEHVFMEEFCTPEEFANDDYCTKAKEMVGTMWTIGTIFSCSGPIIFGTLQQLIGSHWTRVIAGTLTTVGLLLMSFYKTSAYCLLVGVTMVAFPSIAYIMLNSFVAPIYKAITTTLIVMIPGLINSSATSLLIAKKLYESTIEWCTTNDDGVKECTQGLPLEVYFLILFIGSFVIHVRTFFFIPAVPIPKNVDGFHMMKTSIALKLCCRKESKVGSEDAPVGKRPPIKEHWPHVKTLIFIIYAVYYSIITFRINSIRGWMTSWIQFAYESLDCSEFPEFTPEECGNKTADSITLLIDINGYAYFSLAIIPFLPAFLIRVFTSRYPNDYPFAEMRTKLNALLIQMTFCIVVAVACSIIQTFPASAPDSIGLAISLISLSVFMVPLHYATPWLLLFSYFPPPMSQFLYALLTIPSIFISFLNDPLYKIILNGSTEASEYDFSIVSYGMAAASGACILCVFYMFFDIRKMVAKKENDWAMSGSPKIEKRISLQEEGDENIAFDDDGSSRKEKYEMDTTDF